MQREDDILDKKLVLYKNPGDDALFKLHYLMALSPDQLTWAFELTKLHMEEMYNNCEEWGWSDGKKKAELSNPEARFIVVERVVSETTEKQAQVVGSKPGTTIELENLVAFAHFRFVIEEGKAVLYLYEIQVEQAAQGQGLGRHIMTVLEDIARENGIKRVMLTVFNSNIGALAMYARIGYVLDESSPGYGQQGGSDKEDNGW